MVRLALPEKSASGTRVICSPSKAICRWSLVISMVNSVSSTSVTNSFSGLIDVPSSNIVNGVMATTGGSFTELEVIRCEDTVPRSPSAPVVSSSAVRKNDSSSAVGK